MTGVLVTGGTGKTGRAVADALRARGVPLRVAARHPATGDAVHFDWDDATTHGVALDGLDQVYLVTPPSRLDPMPVVGPFLAEADRRGVRRVVLLGSAIVFPDAPGLLEVAARVRERPGGVVLRASGFMQNFLHPHPLAQDVRAHGEIRTSAGTGRVGWIDAEDVAAAAAAVLGDPDAEFDDDYVLTGPRALSYRDAAAIVTERTGRPVRVVDVSVDEVAARNRAAGMPASFADSLARGEISVGAGRDDGISTSVLDLTGRPPRTFDDFVARHASEWTVP